ncbi:hypothetical protein ACTG16_23675 [Aeromonas sp. 23P]|uniref:hypothetical protein n=1 Tax=Aeromonas sp. 23P TaxID=3452716 RepID=UPI003F7A4069|nr:hypothetical protein [Aeromonas veronii]
MAVTAGAPSAKMIAYVKTVCDAYGFGKPNLRSFVAIKDFLDFDAPEQIIQLRKMMTEYATELLGVIEGNSNLDTEELRGRLLNEVVMRHGGKLNNVMSQRLLSEHIPTLRQFKEGLFADVGDKIVANYNQNNTPKVDNKDPLLSKPSGPCHQNEPARQQHQESIIKKNLMPQNHFSKSKKEQDMEPPAPPIRNMHDAREQVIAWATEGYLSLFRSIPTIDIKMDDGRSLLAGALDKGRDCLDVVEDKFATFKSATRLKLEPKHIAEQADIFFKSLRRGVSSGEISKKDCGDFNSIIESNLKKLSSEPNSKWKELVVKIHEILTNAVKGLIQSLNLARAAAFSRDM